MELKTGTGTEDGTITSPEVMTRSRSRHAAELLLVSSRSQRAGPMTRSRGIAPSITSTLQNVAEASAERKKASRAQKSINKALSIDLITKHIISFVNSEADLLSLRLVNRSFHKEATKQFKAMHKPIDLGRHSSASSFISCMKSLKEFDNTLFPFSSFLLDLYESVQLLEDFAALIGPHVRRYELKQYYRPNIFILENADSSGLAILLAKSPQVVEIKVACSEAIYLTASEVARLPMVFPRLRVIDICARYEPDEPEEGSPIIPLLVERALWLNSVRIPYTTQYEETLSVIRILGQKHSHHLPHVLFGKEIVLKPNSPDFVLLENLVSSNLSFKTISILLTHSPDDPDDLDLDLPQNDFRVLIQKLSAWLHTQMSLTSLILDIDIFQVDDFIPFTFELFRLPVLTDLAIEFPSIDTFNLPPNSRLFLPFTPNEFPTLQNLRLSSYREDYGILGLTPLPCVQHLVLSNQETLLSDPLWHDTFPNLTFLAIDIDCPEVATVVANVSFVLTHLHHLTHLGINLVQSIAQEQETNFWNILTGNLPSPPNTQALLSVTAEFPGEPLEQPPNGIYPISSLRNMRALKTLKFYPGCRSNLDAVVYMTLAGLLGPLEKLSLVGSEDRLGLQRGEKLQYRRKLGQVHSEVVVKILQW